MEPAWTKGMPLSRKQSTINLKKRRVTLTTVVAETPAPICDDSASDSSESSDDVESEDVLLSWDDESY